MNRLYYLLLSILLILTGCASKNKIIKRNTASRVIQIQEDGKWGLYELGKGWLLPPTFTKPYEISTLNDGLIKVKDTVGNGYNLYDESLTLLFRTPYEFLFDFTGDYAFYSDVNSNGFIDRRGRDVFSAPSRSLAYQNPKRGNICYTSGDTAIVYNLLTKQSILKSTAFSELILETDSLAIVKQGRNYGVYDVYRQEFVIEATFNGISSRQNLLRHPFIFDPDNILFITSKDERVFVYNKNGEVIQTPAFDHIYIFKNDIAFYKQKSRFGLLTISGQEVLPPFTEALSSSEPTSDKVFPVQTNGLWGIIDRQQTDLVPRIYDRITIIEENRFAYQLNEKWGINSIDNQMIAEALYDEIRPTVSEGYLIFKLGDKYGIMDYDGKVLLPAHYAHIGDF